MSIQIDEKTVDRAQSVIQLLSFGIMIFKMMKKNGLTIEDVQQLFDMESPEQILETVKGATK